MCIDAISYLLGKKNGGSSGGRDWSAIGYTSEPQVIIDGYNYAKQIYDNWDASITQRNSYFQDNYNLIYMPNVDFSNVESAISLFKNCYSLQYVPSINTSNISQFSTMFSGCSSLKNIEELNCEKATKLTSMFSSTNSLNRLGGFKDLGKAYSTTQSANYSNYTLNLSSCELLTHDSLMNVINNLYDIKTKGCNNQSLVLGSTNLAKLTAEEIAIATNKGWNVS